MGRARSLLFNPRYEQALLCPLVGLFCDFIFVLLLKLMKYIFGK